MAKNEWVVVCPDGVVRHGDTKFISRGAAKLWADTGHACMATKFHLITRQGTLDEGGETQDLIEYCCVTDELNDGNPTDLKLLDLDPGALYRAKRWAMANGKNWPPQPGDFDRLYEETRQLYQGSLEGE